MIVGSVFVELPSAMVNFDITRVVFGGEGDVIKERNAQAIFAAHASVMLSTAVVSPLIADLTSVFGVSEARAGLFIIVYTATLIVTIPFAGLVADRIGEKLTVVPGLMIFGIAGGLIAFTTSFELAMILRMAQAVGVAFTQPILVAALGALYRGTREATAQGIRVTIDSVLDTVTPVIAAGLFTFAWFYPFLIYFLTVPLAVILWFSLPELDQRAGKGIHTYITDLTSVLTNPSISFLMISLSFRHMLLYGMYTYVSVLAIREAGMTAVLIGFLLGVRSIMKVISSAQTGRLVGFYGPGVVAISGFGLLGGGMFIMGVVPTTIMLFIGIILLGFGDGLLSPTQKTLINQLSPPQYRNSVMSAGYLFVNLGKTIGPGLIGLGLGFGVISPAGAFALLGGIGGVVGVLLLSSVVYWEKSIR